MNRLVPLLTLPFIFLSAIVASPAQAINPLQMLQNAFGPKGNSDPATAASICGLLASGALNPLRNTGVTETDIQALVDFGSADKLQTLLRLYLAISAVGSERFSGMATLMNEDETQMRTKMPHALKEALFDLCPWPADGGIKPNSLRAYLPQKLQGGQFALPTNFENQIKTFFRTLDRQLLDAFYKASFEAGKAQDDGGILAFVESSNFDGPNDPKQRRALLQVTFAESIKNLMAHIPTEVDTTPALVTWMSREFREVYSGDSEVAAREIANLLLSKIIAPIQPTAFHWLAAGVKQIILNQIAHGIIGLRDDLCTRLARGWRPSGTEDVQLSDHACQSPATHGHRSSPA